MQDLEKELIKCIEEDRRIEGVKTSLKRQTERLQRLASEKVMTNPLNHALLKGSWAHALNSFTVYSMEGNVEESGNGETVPQGLPETSGATQEGIRRQRSSVQRNSQST